MSLLVMCALFCSNMVTMVNQGACSSGPIRLLDFSWVALLVLPAMQEMETILFFIVNGIIMHMHAPIHTCKMLSLSPSPSLSLPLLCTHCTLATQRLTSDTGFSLGALGRPPDPHKADKLGSGGNGSVFGYFQNGKQFAVKKVNN